MDVDNAVFAPEAKLVERLKRREEAAFDELVTHYSARLVAVARRILGDEELARDAVQETFLNAHRGIESFNGEARLGSWLHRIATNAALGRLRQRRRRPERFLADELGGGSDEDPLEVNEFPLATPTVEAVDDSLARRQQCDLVRSCIERLKTSHRLVLTLRYLEEHDTKQTAKILGIGPNTVKTRLLRARDALRTFLEEEREWAESQLAESDLCASDRTHAA